MKATQAGKGSNHHPAGCDCGMCRKLGGTHGGTGTPEYSLWKEIRRKCSNPRRGNYQYYGGRGITVCERWNGSFEDFLADVGRRPGPDYTLDRIDNVVLRLSGFDLGALQRRIQAFYAALPPQ